MNFIVYTNYDDRLIAHKSNLQRKLDEEGHNSAATLPGFNVTSRNIT